MQGIIANQLPDVMSYVSAANNSFDTFLNIIQKSAIAAVVFSALLIPILWISIFTTWRMRIMEMRQGRSVALEEYYDVWSCCDMLYSLSWSADTHLTESK
jgi:hypothetical protein